MAGHHTECKPNPHSFSPHTKNGGHQRFRRLQSHVIGHMSRDWYRPTDSQNLFTSREERLIAFYAFLVALAFATALFFLSGRF